jgi:hypothetical protein
VGESVLSIETSLIKEFRRLDKNCQNVALWIVNVDGFCV